MFRRPVERQRAAHASQDALDSSLRGPRCRRDDGFPPTGFTRMAARDGRGAPDEEVTRGDQLVERAAAWLETQADQAAAQGGNRAKLANILAEDAEFVRKLKPSLIAARARGEAPTDEKPGSPPRAPRGPQLGRRPQPNAKAGRGRLADQNPFVVVAIALAAGIVLAKMIDWRGHAHPRD